MSLARELRSSRAGGGRRGPERLTECPRSGRAVGRPRAAARGRSAGAPKARRYEDELSTDPRISSA